MTIVDLLPIPRYCVTVLGMETSDFGPGPTCCHFNESKLKCDLVVGARLELERDINSSADSTPTGSFADRNMKEPPLNRWRMRLP